MGSDSSKAKKHKNVADEQKQHKCVQCNKIGATKRCSRCKKSYYCNQECQRANWQMHKESCVTSLPSAKSMQPNPNVKQRKVIDDIKYAQPQFVLSTETEQKTEKFKVCIGVDFGTDGLGIAYAFDNNVYVHDKWRSKNYGAITKPKTTVLLDQNGQVVAIGMDAKHIYFAVDDTDDQFMLFERYKMSLYDEELDKMWGDHVAENDEKVSAFHYIDIQNKLTATNKNATCASQTVFVAVFEHIGKQCKKYLRKQKVRVKDAEIQWIITVPAIWNEKAKRKMKNWIVESKLVDKNSPNQCKIVYEPECASLAMQYYMRQINNVHYDKDKPKNQNKIKINSPNEIIIIDEMKEPFSKGDKYILVDSGGGTCDIVCHEVVGEFSVEELHHPSGGPW
eukprot:438685_1